MLYLDNNSTTPLLPEVLEAMLPHLTGPTGNPASAHTAGRQARRALEDAREEVASLLGAWPDEVVFTSGATESNNLALFGLSGDPPGQLISSALEHPSVSEPLRQLEKAGFLLTLLPLDRIGRIAPETLRATLTEQTRVVAVQLANHEVGTLQDIPTLAATLPPQAFFHCDAVQAVGKVPVDFHKLGVTTLAFTAHKLHGPRGIGGLLVRRCTPLHPLLFGGHQQRGLRPGTEPVALVVGLATALRWASEQLTARWHHVLTLRQRLLGHLRELAPSLNGPAEGGIPHTVNLSFPGLKGDLLLMALDLAGVACSTGSACSSGSLLPSPVLQAMGVEHANLTSALRFSLSPLLTGADIDESARRILAVVQRLRQGPALGLPAIRA
jgi:cysteine desulfurase